MSEPEITDEMVEAGARAAWRDHEQVGRREDARACLAAALPHSALLAEIKALKGENELFCAVVRAAQEIDREGYVESMQNVPSWQRLAQALEALSYPSAPTQGENP